MALDAKARRIKERIYKGLFAALAFASLLFLVGITITLFLEGGPVFKEVPFLKFVFGKYWYPTHEDAEFGILPLILGSFWVTLGAVCVLSLIHI